MGIPRSTYYDYLKRHPEIVAQNKEAARLVQAQTLGMILLHQRQLMEKILAEALADGTSTRDRLAIMKYLDQREKDLFEMGAGKNEDDDPAARLIEREIILTPAKSKMYQKREE